MEGINWNKFMATEFLIAAITKDYHAQNNNYYYYNVSLHFLKLKSDCNS